MKDKNFDDIFRAKLQQLQPPIAQPDWEEFSKIMESRPSFDEQVADKLNEIDTSNVSQHWLLMHERLQNILYLKERLLTVKIFESILILALMLTFVNISGVLFNCAKEDSIAALAVHKVADTQQPQPITNTKTNSAVGASSHKENQEPTSQLGMVQKDETSPLRIVELNFSKPSSNEGILLSAPSESQVTSKVQATLGTASALTTVIIDDNDIRELNEPNKPTLITTPDCIDPKEENALVLNTIITAIPQAISPAFKPHLSVILLSGIDANLIATPFDAVYKLPGYKHQALGTHAGIGLSYDRPIWSIESSASFINLSYTPRLIEETFSDGNNYYQASLEGIGFNMLAIPITAKLYTNQYNKFSFYGLLGVQASFVMQSEFTIRNTESGAVSTIENFPNPQTKLFTKAFEEGISDGGGLAQNAYLSIHAGLGLQYRFTSSFSLFGQSSYQSNVDKKGIGPNEDKLNAVNFTIGAKLNPFAVRHRK